MPNVSARPTLIRAALLAAALTALAVAPMAHAPEPPATWSEVERLVKEQKFEEASRRVDALLQSAKERKDSADWTRALIRSVQLRTGLHGYETAVRFLKDEPWPPDLLSRAALELFYAQSLVTYAQVYSWEISQRERVESTGAVDLKAWTREQIYGESARAYFALWKDREALGRKNVKALSEFMAPNDYPDDIRSTMRDAVAYFFTALLANSSGWSPAESNAVFTLDLPGLLRADAASTAAVKPDDPAVHPVTRLTAVLADLEGWHAAQGNRQAAFEARLERLRRLHAAFTQAEDQAAVERDLEARLPAMRDLPWFSMGQAQLAEFLEGARDQGDLVRAREVAEQGRVAYPGAVGGQRCRVIVERIEAPDYQLRAMRADGPDRRSILVTHKNVASLTFRAYLVDLPARVAAARDLNQILPNRDETEAILSGTPAARWTVQLPATPDFRHHQTFVVPKVSAKGFYLVAASGGQTPGEERFPVFTTAFLLSDLVLMIPQEADRAPGGAGVLELRTLSGGSGQPVGGADVMLLRGNWNPLRVERIADAHTDAGGYAALRLPDEKQWSSRFLFARRGPDLAYDTNVPYLAQPATPETTASLVFTDRSIYRPTQTILWKILAYRGNRTLGRFEAYPQSAVTVTLVDQNNQAIDSRSVTTNDYGSAAGEFVIPTGRALGSWRVETSLSGSAGVRVEEYKRPTFEVTL